MNSSVMQSSARPRAATLRTVLGLFKLRIGTLIMITALAGMAMASGPGLSLAQVVVLALAVMSGSPANKKPG